MKIKNSTLERMIEEERFILMERISDEVYRYVTSTELESVLKTDKFHLTAAIGTGSEMEKQSKKKIFYLSTTRGRGGDYHSSPSQNYALIKLNGRKLGQRYSGKAVDYWADKSQSLRGTGKSEAEDRIYSDKPYIPKASQYIKEIHFLIKDAGSPENLYGQMGDLQKQNLRKIMMAAKKRNIKMYFYNNKRDFILMNPKNSVKIDLKSLKRDKEDVKAPGYYRYKGVERSSFAVWTELLAKKKTSELTKKAKDKRYDVSYYSDQVKVLANDIHNSKQIGSALDKRIVTFIAFMKKLKLRNPQDVIDFIKDKWEKIGKAEDAAKEK
jgi:hypothetical protein